MRVAIVLPRGTHFGPEQATAIDLCVHDAVLMSRFRDQTRVFVGSVDHPFTDVPVTKIHQVSTGARIRAFRRAISTYCPQVIVVHQHLASALAIARAFPKIPTLLYKHNVIRSESFWPKRLLRRRQLRHFAGIIFVSRFCADAFAAAFGDDMPPARVVHNGLDIDAWKPSAHRQKTVLFTGRATPEKGVFEAAVAAGNVLASRHDWCTRFILSTLDADDDYLAKIKATLAPLGSRAEIHLNMTFTAVKNQVETAAIAMVPSRFEEPFGRTAIEAMAGGAALVSSFRGGLAEVCEGAALRVDPENPEAFARALSHLMDSSDDRADLARRGRSRVAQHFTIQETSDHLDQLYEAAVSGRIPLLPTEQDVLTSK